MCGYNNNHKHYNYTEHGNQLGNPCPKPTESILCKINVNRSLIISMENCYRTLMGTWSTRCQLLYQVWMLRNYWPFLNFGWALVNFWETVSSRRPNIKRLGRCPRLACRCLFQHNMFQHWCSYGCHIVYSHSAGIWQTFTVPTLQTSYPWNYFKSSGP